MNTEELGYKEYKCPKCWWVHAAITTAPHRGKGIGRELVVQGISRAQQLHPGHRIRISAQLYLERFYADLGFQSVSDPYDDDGIMHVDMLC